jgi:hypothetical protein
MPHWQRAGLNIDRWCVEIPEDWHLEQLHGNGDIPGVGAGGLWNENWRQFFIERPNATGEQIWEQADTMITGFGLPRTYVHFRRW